MNSPNERSESDAEIFARFRALPGEERQRLSPLLLARSCRHWRTWMGFAILIACVLVGSGVGKHYLGPALGVLLGSMIGGASGGAAGALVLAMIQRPIQARHLRELLAERDAARE